MPTSPETFAAPSFAATVTVSAPTFTRDGSALLYLSGAGLSSVWRLDLASGERRCLTTLDEQIALLRRSPIDDRIIIGVDTGGDERQRLLSLDLNVPDAAPVPLTHDDAVIHDWGGFSPDGQRIVFAANARDEAHFDIHEQNLATGARHLVWRGEGIVTVAGYNKDATKIAALQDRAYGDMELLIVDAATGAATPFPRPSGTNYQSVRWSTEGTTLLALTDHGGHEHPRLCRLDPASGAVTVVYEVPGRDIEAWSLSPDGATLATVENDRGWSVLRLGPLSGPCAEPAGLPRGVIADLVFSPDSGTLVFSVQGPVTPPALWLWRDGQARPLFTPEQPFALTGLADFTLAAWESFDGKHIPGWLALPHGPVPDMGHKTVIWVHGGPIGQARPNFRPDLQNLLAQGCAVLMPNVRGGSGQGRSWAESDDFGKRPDAVRDLIHARDFLAAHPATDAKRLGLLGQSYGGYMVNAAVTEYPELWKACADYYGIVDFTTTLAGTGPWRRGHRAAEYGDPEQDAALFARISPIHRVDRIQAPMLVAHGLRDPRVPFSESETLVAALRERRKSVVWLTFKRAGHGFVRLEDKMRVYDEVAAFFVKYL